MNSEELPNRSWEEAVEVLDAAYGDDLVAQYAAGEQNCGDTLAAFVAYECKDLYDPELNWAAQCDEWITALRRAQEDLEDVIQGLIAAH